MIPLIILAILIVVNGIFALAETAVLSSRRARLKKRAMDGDSGAQAAYKLAKHPTRFLATVQLVITLIGILSGAFAQQRLSGDLESWLVKIPALSSYSGVAATVILVLTLTLVFLVLGELIPKRIARMFPETIAAAIATPMNWLSRLVGPVVKILSIVATLILSILQLRPPKEEPVTQEELRVLIEEGTSAGIFDQTEQDIVKNVFRLAERRSGAIMTPRTDIVFLDINETQESIRRIILEQPHAFYPIVDDHMDHVLGVLSAKDIMTRVLANQEIDLQMLMSRPLIVPESISVLQMLDSFRENPAQIAFVADEYGSISGIVTQNAVVEAIVGELPTIEEGLEPDMVQREDGSYLVNGTMAADDLREQLKLIPFPEQNHYDTVAGFALLQLQRIPSAGDVFEWGGAKFEIVDMDGKRIDKLIVVPPVLSGPLDDASS